MHFTTTVLVPVKKRISCYGRILFPHTTTHNCHDRSRCLRLLSGVAEKYSVCSCNVNCNLRLVVPAKQRSHFHFSLIIAPADYHTLNGKYLEVLDFIVSKSTSFFACFHSALMRFYRIAIGVWVVNLRIDLHRFHIHHFLVQWIFKYLIAQIF